MDEAWSTRSGPKVHSRGTELVGPECATPDVGKASATDDAASGGVAQARPPIPLHEVRNGPRVRVGGLSSYPPFGGHDVEQ